MLPFSECLDIVALFTNIFERGTRIKTVYFFLLGHIFVFPKISYFVTKVVCV